jgi:glycosyltransferase involved in cell wall biosynthesis
LVADAEEASLARGIERLMAADRQGLGEAGRAFARDRLSWESSANAFVDGVRSALA